MNILKWKFLRKAGEGRGGGGSETRDRLWGVCENDGREMKKGGGRGDTHTLSGRSLLFIEEEEGIF